MQLYVRATSTKHKSAEAADSAFGRSFDSGVHALMRRVALASVLMGAALTTIASYAGTPTLSGFPATHSVQPEGFSTLEISSALTIADTTSITYSVPSGSLFMDRTATLLASEDLEKTAGGRSLTLRETPGASGKLISAINTHGRLDNIMYQPERGSTADVTLAITATSSTGGTQTRTVTLKVNATPLVRNIPTQFIVQKGSSGNLDFSALSLDAADPTRSVSLSVFIDSNRVLLNNDTLTAQPGSGGVPSCSATASTGAVSCGTPAYSTNYQATPSQLEGHLDSSSTLRFSFDSSLSGTIEARVYYRDTTANTYSLFFVPINSPAPVFIAPPPPALELARSSNDPKGTVKGRAFDPVMTGSTTHWFDFSNGTPPFTASVSESETAEVIIKGSKIGVRGLRNDSTQLDVVDANGLRFSKEISFKATSWRIFSEDGLLNGTDDEVSFSKSFRRGGLSTNFGTSYGDEIKVVPYQEFSLQIDFEPESRYFMQEVDVLIMVKDPVGNSYMMNSDQKLIPYRGTLISYESLTLRKKTIFDLGRQGPLYFPANSSGKWEITVGYQLPDGAIFYNKKPYKVRVGR